MSDRLLEESLTNPLVDNDKSDVRSFKYLCLNLPIQIIFEGNNLVELSQFLINDLFSHGVTDSVSINKDVFWHGSIVEVSVALEGSLEVVREDSGRNNFLSLHRLRASLSIVLAHVGVIGSAEPNCTLFTFVANIDTHEHSLFGNLLAE